MFTVVTKAQEKTFKTLNQAESFINKFYDLNAGVVTLSEDGKEVATFKNNNEKYAYFKFIPGTAANRKAIKFGDELAYRPQGSSSLIDQ
jgi:hypothetical protein